MAQDNPSEPKLKRNLSVSRKAFAILLFLGSFAVGTLLTAKPKPHVSIREVSESPSSGGLVTALVHEIGGKHFLYTGGGESELDSFVVSDDGALAPLKSYTLWKKRGPARGLVAATVQGKDYLYVGNKWGNAIEVHRIHEDGMLTRLDVVEDTEDTHLGVIITMQVVKMGEEQYIFAGGLEKRDPGLTSFKIEQDGSLTHVQSMSDTDEVFTDGIIGMVLHRFEGKTFLVTGGFQDSGVSNFRIHEDGTFENVSNLGDDLNLFLNGTYPVDGVTLGGNHYVVVGHRHHSYYNRGGFIKNPNFVYHGDGLTILKMDESGTLAVHETLYNTPRMRLRGQTRLAVSKVSEDQAIIIVGTREDESLQACLLDQDGKLEPVSHFDCGFEIYNGMTYAEIAGHFYVFAGPVPGKGTGVHSYRIELQSERMLSLK